MTYKKFYLYSIIMVVLASFYPLYMGIITINSYLKKGCLNVSEYPKYIIPYTPICIALIAATILMPLIFKLFKRYSLPVVSLFATLLYFGCEQGFEQIKVSEVSNNITMPIESWQFSLCRATPEVLRAIGEPIHASNNLAFKIHFYIISVVIILAVINTIYGFSNMLLKKDFRKKRPLIAQAVSVVVFIGLCILACFTAFYRNGTINISTLSATLMSIFFIVYGVTVGIYCGSIFYGRNVLLSKLLPSIVSSLTVVIMYIGELVLMGGVLFRYGKGFLFDPIGSIPFSIVDFSIILISGIITYSIMRIYECIE